MSVVIRKQLLSFAEEQIFTPGGEVRKVLTVQIQGGYAYIWYEVNLNAGPSFQTEVHIRAVGTGHPAPPSRFAYVSTTQVGESVWHWYVKRVFLP